MLESFLSRFSTVLKMLRFVVSVMRNITFVAEILVGKFEAENCRYAAKRFF